MSDDNDPLTFESPFHVNHPKDSADQMERMADEFLKERDQLEAEISRLNRQIDAYRSTLQSIRSGAAGALFFGEQSSQKEKE